MAFVDGPAGSMKTYIAVYAGLELIRDESFSRLVYICREEFRFITW
jgi:predicted ribonuclease YlaK